MDNNIFTVLGIQTKEDCVSNVLAFAINDSNEFRNDFLKAICGIDEYPLECKAHTRVSTKESGVPDIVLVCRYHDKHEIIVIENKLKAHEGDDQTVRYSSDSCKQDLITTFCQSDSLHSHEQTASDNTEFGFVFLTLFPDEKPKAGNVFKETTHKELIPLKGIIPSSKLAGKLMDDWLTLLEKFYEKSRIADNDILVGKLHDEEHDLDGGYLYFRTFVAGLNLGNGLKKGGCFRNSGQGRHYYATTISKEGWHPGVIRSTNGSYFLDLETVFNIHFEPQFHVLNGKLDIYLHYELNPYHPVKWANANLPVDQYEAYKQRRNRFYDLLEDNAPRQWKLGNHSNQLAKVEIDFQGYTMKDALVELEQLFEEASYCIDKVLAKL